MIHVEFFCYSMHSLTFDLFNHGRHTDIFKFAKGFIYEGILLWSRMYFSAWNFENLMVHKSVAHPWHWDSLTPEIVPSYSPHPLHIYIFPIPKNRTKSIDLLLRMPKISSPYYHHEPHEYKNMYHAYHWKTLPIRLISCTRAKCEQSALPSLEY